MRKIYLFKKMASLLAAGALFVGTGGIASAMPSTAIPTNAANQSVWYEGDRVLVQGYLIDGNNYFRLRDIANLYDFEVTYENGVVNMIYDGYEYRPYQRKDGEVNYIDASKKTVTTSAANVRVLKTTPLETQAKPAVLSWHQMPHNMKAYLIDDENYIMLRDVAVHYPLSVEFIAPDDRLSKLLADPMGDDGNYRVWTVFGNGMDVRERILQAIVNGA